MSAPVADLTGWSVEPFTGGGYTHDVYRKRRRTRRGADPRNTGHPSRACWGWATIW